MRPRRLTISAFGPFAGTEVVDFTGLVGHDLLLIEGPTGAGKSTLLDAMTYALFGSVPGARREIEHELKSAWADPAADCEVVFEFALGERVFRAGRRPAQDRPKRRGAGVLRQPAFASLVELGAAGERPVCPPKVNEVDAAITALLGLTVEQFKQVLLLPQGDFRQFLLAKSTDKEPLLEMLFGTAFYKDVSERLGAEKRELERRLERLEHAKAELLAVKGSGAAIDLGAAIAGARQELASAEDAARVAAERARRAGLRRERAEAVASDLERRARARAAAEAARRAEAHAAPQRADLAAAEAVEPLRVFVAASAREAAGAAELSERAAGARAARGAADAALAAAEAAAAARPGLRAELEGLAGRAAVLRELGPVARALAERAAAARALAAEVARLEQELALATSRVEAARAADVALGERLRAAHAASEGAPAKAAAAAAASERAAGHRELAKLVGQRDALAEEISRLGGRVLAARHALDEAAAAVRLRREARERGLATELAAGLVDGQPCPVCGAVDHPEPARAGPGASLTSIAEAERRETEYRDGLAQLEQTLAARRGSHAHLQQAVDAQRDKLAGAGAGAVVPVAQAVADAERARADAERAVRAEAAARELAGELERRGAERAVHERAQQALAERLAGRRAELDGAQTVAEHERTRLAAALGEGVTLAQAVADNDLRARALAAEVARLDEGLIAARSAKDAAHAAERAALDAHAEQTCRAADATAAALAEARALGLADVAEAERRLMPAEARAALRAQLDALGLARAAADADLATAEQATAGADLDALADAAALAERRADAERAERTARAAAEAVGAQRTALAELEGTQARIAARAAEAAAIDQELRVLGHLARVVAGQNPLNMSLPRYVLAARMEEVAVAASERLAAMSRGRYRLRRTDEVRHGGRGSGLDLVVDDAHTGHPRSVHSLSGGEMFMASLSLAMGLADVVQAHAGGLRLDSLFIDEGFGTLDDETLDQVMRTLEDLRAGGRLVGVISHVAELKERLGTRLTVQKGQRGSTTRMVI
jgi:exonuclease SbcC